MIEQTTLHNILTWIIAVVLFIFQSLNYFIAWIKKYVKHGQKTTTVVTADTTISSESILNNKNVPENVINVQGLIQKHFDIPLIIAEDEPKVYSFIKSAQLLTSNEIRKEKTKIDQFMENLVDDSYVARGLGLITATVGRQSEFYLYSKYDNNFENVIIRLNGRNGEIGQITISSKNPTNIVEPKSIPMDYIYDKDRIKVTYTPFAEGVYTLTLVRNSLSICRSPYYISVEKSPTNSRSQIRLGTKKYKPVTKFAKSKHSPLETCDNSIPAIEPSKPSICKNILPESEKNSIRTDVMSIVTKFESNSINFQKKVHKSTSSISEKGSETDMINEIPKYSNILPRIETDNVHNTYVSDLNSPSIHSKTKSTDKNFWNDVDITYKNSKASDNTIDFESERIKKPMTMLNKHVGITKDIPEVKNVSSTRLQPTNSVLVKNLKIENLHDVEKHNETFKTIELMDENKLIEKRLDPTTRISESEIKCIDNEPCIQNEVSCFDDEDRKTVVVMDSNEIESNPNDTVIQQMTDSAQYNINTPFASVITKITNSICEKCSIQVLKIISEFPRDINITHKNNSNEMRSSFETLLAQPISININIDNMFEQPISATNEHDNEHLLTISPTKIKHIGTIDEDIKYSYLNEIEPIDNNSDELCGNVNNMSKELMIKQNKHNGKIDETIKDEIFDHCTVLFAEHTINKYNTVRKNNEMSKNEIIKIEDSTTNEDNVLHSNHFNNNTIHKSDNKMEVQKQHLQKSSEHSIDLIKTNQFHKNINKELNHISKESNEPLDISDVVTINYDKNTNCELVTEEFKINNVIIPGENTNIQRSVINNIVLSSKEVTLATTEYKSEDNEEQANNISYKHVTLTSIKNENQKLMIEKSIEPVLTSFKNKMVEIITQLYLNRDLSNTNNNSTFETHDKHLTNNLHEIEIKNNANSTEIKAKCIETPTSQLKNYTNKNEISEIILDQQKTDSNHLHKYVESIIKTKINPSGLYAHTLGEIKLQTLVNTAMNHPNDQQIGNEFKNVIIDNDNQNDKLKKVNNDEIVQDIKAMLVEIPSVTIIKNTDELIIPKNEVTVTTQCKIPLIDDFDTIEIENTNTDSKQEMQTINGNGNDTIVENNAVEIKALQNFQKPHNTEIITPIIELRPTLETRIMNTSELVTVEENSSKEIETAIEIIDSINIPEETNAVENIDDKNEYESVKLQFKENVIKIPHLVEKETLNEVVGNTSTNTSAKSDSTENVSMQAEIESPGLTKVYSANDVTVERDIIYKLPPLAENIVIEKSNSQSIPTLNAQVSKNAAKVTIGINTSDPQFSNTAITVLIPSKIPLIENNSFIPKLRILNTLNKLNAIEILKIPKYSACDTKITKRELQNTSEPTLSPNKLYMKNIKLEKKENIDEPCIPSDTEIETLEYLNKSGKIKSIPPISNVTLAETTVESKTEKNTLHKTLNPKYKVTTLESTVNEINCNNTKNETTIPISSLDGEMMEKPMKKPDKKVDEMLMCTEAETSTVIDTSMASLVHKIVVEFVTNKNKTPIEALEIIVHEQIEEDIVTVRETTPTMNSLVAVMKEQVNIKIDGSDTYYVRSDDNVINIGPKTRKSIRKNNAEKMFEKESPVPINTLTGVVMENPKMNIVPVTAITSCTNSSTETIDVKTDVEKVFEEESPSPTNSLGELVQENMNININTENKTLLPTESTVESIVESKIEDITEPEITSCTESSTEINNVQYHAEKIVDEVLIDSLGEVKGESTIMKIVTENETLLSIGSTKESMVEPKIEEDITVTTKTACADSSILTVDIKTDVEKVFKEESPSPINSLGELVQENMNININTENKTLLPTESTAESIVESKIEDITEPEITSCTESSTEIINVQYHAEKIVDEVLIDSLGEVKGENMIMKIVTENETLLSIGLTKESMVEPKIEDDITVTTKTACSDSSTLTVDVQTDVEKVIEEESMASNNSLSEVVVLNIDTENETLLQIEKITGSMAEKKEKDGLIQTILPMKLTMESIKEPKVIEDITETEIISCTESLTKITQYQDHTEQIFDQEAPLVPIYFSEEEVDGKSKVIIDTETETHLPIVSKIESIEKPKLVEGIITTKIPYCAESSTEITNMQMDPDNVIVEQSPTPINFLSEIIRVKTKVNINTESDALPIANYVEEKEVIEETSEIVLPIESAMEFIQDPKIEEDIIEIKIRSCADSSTVDIQKDIKNVIEEESSTPINLLGELLDTNTKDNIDTENEILLPIDSITGSMEEKKEKDGHIEPLLTIKSTMESIKEQDVVEDITKTKIKSCTILSTENIMDAQTNNEKYMVEKCPEPINSSVEEVGGKSNANIDTKDETFLPIVSTKEFIEETKIEPTVVTETKILSCTGKETILPVKTSTYSMEDRKAIEGTTEIVLPIESTIELKKEPKVVVDKTITEITPCTDSSSVIVETKTGLEKVIEEVPTVLINNSCKIIEEKTKVNMDTEYETILPIGSTIESVEESNAVEYITETEITSCTESLTENIMDVQSNNEKYMSEKSPAPINSSVEDVARKLKVNFDTENETFLPMVPTKESIEKGLDEDTPEPINSSRRVVVEKINMNIDTGHETILPIKTSTYSVEDRKAIEGTTEIVLPIESTMEFKKEPKVVVDKTIAEITPCTDSSSVIVETKTGLEKVIEKVPTVLINNSCKIIGEKTKVNMDTEYETILPIEATIESIEEQNLVEDITETKIKSCTIHSTENIMDAQTNNEKYMVEKCPEPINSSVEEVGGKSNANIDTKDETFLPIVSTKEFIEETKIEPTVVTETKIISCTESSTIIINHQNHTEKIIDEKSIKYLSEVMGENINVNIVTQNEIHLPIESTVEAVEESYVVEDITEIKKRSSNESSSIILETKIYVEKMIEENPSVLIDPSDKVVGENPKVNMDIEYETILPIESTIESIPESEIYEDITETEILSCTDSSTGNVVAQTDVEKVIGEVSLTLINSSDKVVGRKMNVNIDNENETLLPIDTSTGYVKDKKETYIIETLLPIKSTVITEPEITSCTESSTEMINNQDLVLINSSGEVVRGNTNVNIDTETETLLSIGSTMESIEVSKKKEDIKETKNIPSTNSLIVTVDIQTDVKRIMDKESPSLINSFGELVQENMNMNINTENETLLTNELTIESIKELNLVDNRTEIEITSYDEPLTKIINPQFHATEKIVDKVKINSLGEVMGENMNMKIVTENETLLSISSTKESMVEPKIEEDITVTTKTACTDSSTLTVDVQTDVEKVFEEESPSPTNSLGELVQENMNININTENKTLLPTESTVESIVESKIEDRTEPEITSCTESSTEIINIQYHAEKIVDEVLGEPKPKILGENTKVNTENETILPIDSTKELTVEPKVEADITETAKTLCTDSSTVTADVQTGVEKVIEEVFPAPIHSSGEEVGKSTKLYIDTENETVLQNDTSITTVKAVKEEKIIENEYLTPTFSQFLDVEKQINVIIDSKTETSFPTGTNTTLVNEPNLVWRVSENEHAALIDPSIRSIKQQIKVDTETEIETLLLIDNLTESIKEQIVEKITENKTPTLIDSLAEMVEERSKVNIDTDNQTLLTINPSSTVVDDQIVKNGIENETQTPIYCVVNVSEEQTKVNIETNNKTITPIDIFTTSIEEQLNVEYLCENENTMHIDSVPTMIKNQTKIDNETEIETLLSIENTFLEKQMDEVDKIIQNNLLVDFSAATELKGYEILTDTEIEKSTSIDTLNTTVDRQTVKENFKEIKSRIQIVTSTAFKEEQKSVEHKTVKENLLSIGTSTASVEEDIQVEEVIENESATLISYSTIHDVASLEEPKVIKNDTTAMRSFVTVVEEQMEVAAAEVVIDTCKESLDKTMIEKSTRHNETPTPIDILGTATEKQPDLERVTENEIPILVNTSTKSEEKQIKTEKITENETITLIACEALPKIETNEFEAESENETTTPLNNSSSITIKQTEAEDITETTLQNDKIIYRNTKTYLIGTENKTENSDNCYLKFGESSKMHRLENEDNLQRKSYGIQKLEMSVQRMKTSDEDYYEKTFVQLEPEKISKVDKVNVDGENKTIIDDKLYTVNESDLNAILCASSLEEALTMLDSKIKFKFKHKKSSSKINSVEYIPKIQTSDNNSSDINTNFTDARKFFKEIEKKSKK